MDDPFEIPVQFKGEELLFPARLQQLGYTHRIVVNVHGVEIFFEPDEERNYRALVDEEQRNQKTSVELIRSIAAAIEAILR